MTTTVNDVAGGFMYAWSYTVPARHRSAFVAAYSPSGTWATLFRPAAGYIGTELFRDQHDPERFLTIDRWESPAAFRQFRERHSTEFEALDLACEQWTAHEVEIGQFVPADTATSAPEDEPS